MCKNHQEARESSIYLIHLDSTCIHDATRQTGQPSRASLETCLFCRQDITQAMQTTCSPQCPICCPEGEIQILMRKFFCESRLEIPQTCYFCFIVCHSDSMMWFEGLFQPGSSYFIPKCYCSLPHFTRRLQCIPSDNLQANHIFLYCSLAGLPSKYSTPDLLYLGTLQWWLWSWDVLQ